MWRRQTRTGLLLCSRHSALFTHVLCLLYTKSSVLPSDIMISLHFSILCLVVCFADAVSSGLISAPRALAEVSRCPR